MSVGHYENFPVASVLLPAALRRPVTLIYRFARTADDFADEGDLRPHERLALLAGYRSELRRIEAGRSAESPLFRELGEVVAAHRLPLAPFHDLLDAFSQDVAKQRYASFAELMDYCRRSADPVGRLMLHLFGVSEDQIAAGDASGGWWNLMRFQIERARSMMLAGAPLAKRLPVRIGLEIGTVVQGGLRILEKLDEARGDMFRHRPVLRAWDWPLMLTRALVM